jgi:hypothetical protein
LIICLDNDEQSKNQAYKIADIFREALLNLLRKDFISLTV